MPCYSKFTRDQVKHLSFNVKLWLYLSALIKAHLVHSACASVKADMKSKMIKESWLTFPPFLPINNTSNHLFNLA